MDEPTDPHEVELPDPPAGLDKPEKHDEGDKDQQPPLDETESSG